MRLHWRFLCAMLSILVGIVTVACLSPMTTPTAATGTIPAFDHIFTIAMENHSYSDIIGSTVDAPYINQLAAHYGVAANYAAVAHPSLPNYLALTGASTFGITSDCMTCFVNQPNIAVDRVQRSGRTWKAYMESMPSACFVGDAYPYAQRHDPFIYYDDVRLNSAECKNVVPYTQLRTDLASTTATPNYVWITPNVIDDMHDGTIAQGDTWLKNNVPLILSSPAFVTQKSLLVIVWDEAEGSVLQNNQVLALVIAKGIPAGFKSSVQYDHYSLVKTVEAAWGLKPLTSNDQTASPMSSFFPSATP